MLISFSLDKDLTELLLEELMYLI